MCSVKQRHPSLSAYVTCTTVSSSSLPDSAVLIAPNVRVLLYSPIILTLTGLLSLTPAAFSASHSYLPWSVLRASVTAKLPPSATRTRRDEVRSRARPSLRHLTTGAGFPLGATHCRTKGSPRSASVSLGSVRNSSRRTASSE